MIDFKINLLLTIGRPLPAQCVRQYFRINVFIYLYVSRKSADDNGRKTYTGRTIPLTGSQYRPWSSLRSDVLSLHSRGCGKLAAEMSRYRTALQSFSIESLIGAKDDDCVVGRDTGVEKETGGGGDKDDFGGVVTAGFECPSPPSEELLVAHAESSSAAHRYDWMDAASGLPTFGTRDRRLSTLFSSMLDTAIQQQQQLEQPPLPPPPPPPPLHFDYFKALQLQSAATAGKTFSPQSLWPYLSEVIAFPHAPPQPPCYLQPPPPPLLPSLFGCTDEAYEDDDHVSSCNVTPPIVGKSAGRDLLCRHQDDEDDEEDEEDDDDADDDCEDDIINEADVGDYDDSTANPRFGE